MRSAPPPTQGGPRFPRAFPLLRDPEYCLVTGLSGSRPHRSLRTRRGDSIPSFPTLPLSFHSMHGSSDMDTWTWFDPSANVKLMHPDEIERGMRLAREVTRPDGSPGTELLPVWDVSIGGGYSPYGGIGRSFRTMDGELRQAASNSRVWADPEIRREHLPPHDAKWITHQKFGIHDQLPGALGDRYFYQRTRAVDTYTAEDGRVYRLLHGRSTRQDSRRAPENRWSCYWVYRWDRGVKWLGPSRETSSLAYDQFDMIREGRAW